MAVTNYHTVRRVLLGESTVAGGFVGYKTDALGSVVATSSSTGSIANTYRFKPYGGQLAKTGTAADPAFTYLGAQGVRQTDLAFAETYNRRRHYGTQTASFSCVASFWPRERPYNYALSSPLTLGDVNGLITGVLALPAAGAITAGGEAAGGATIVEGGGAVAVGVVLAPEVGVVAVGAALIYPAYLLGSWSGDELYGGEIETPPPVLPFPPHPRPCLAGPTTTFPLPQPPWTSAAPPAAPPVGPPAGPLLGPQPLPWPMPVPRNPPFPYVPTGTCKEIYENDCSGRPYWFPSWESPCYNCYLRCLSQGSWSSDFPCDFWNWGPDYTEPGA